MFTKRTVFVIGAGASAEFGLPIGSKLQERISDSLNIRWNDSGKFSGGDFQLYQLIQGIPGYSHDEHFKLLHLIAQAMPLTNSIDTFLENFASNEILVRIGKLAIARTILEAERTSSLFKDVRSQRVSNLLPHDNWCNRVFRLLQQNRRAEEAHRFFENCTFVVFNYDRVAEQFFYEALSTAYGMHEQHAAEAVSTAEFLHPYGSVGRLPWQQKTGPKCAFGEVPSSIHDIAGEVQTYSESTIEGDEIDLIRNRMQEAQVICFLGFSYLPQNLRLLVPEKRIVQGRNLKVFGTAYGLSEFNANSAASDVNSRLNSRYANPQLGKDKQTCADFIDAHTSAFR